MNEQSQISRTYKQDIGSNGSKEDIVCWYELLIFNIHLSTADILPTIIMVFVVVCGLLPLVFALSSTKLSIFTLVDLVLLATCSYFLLSHLEDIKSTNLREVNTEVRSWLRALRVRYGT